MIDILSSDVMRLCAQRTRTTHAYVFDFSISLNLSK